MLGTSTSPAASPSIPSFVPVPLRSRRDGWTEERQRIFIATLARTRCVGRAAAAAGMSRESAYRLRRRKGAASFAAAWDSIFAARPRGTTGFDLVWHRMIERVGGAGARIRRDSPAPEADRYEEALRRFVGGPQAPGGRGRSQ
jgi:hypothetical protein